MDLGKPRHDPRLGPAAVDPAARRVPCRPLVRARRRRRYRARGQDARGGLRGGRWRLTHSIPPGSALLAGIGASVAFALVHGFASISQRGNQIVSGVAINMLAAGLTAIVGNAWYGQGGRTPPLEGDQRFGDVLFGHSALVYSRAARRAGDLVRPRQERASACACAPSARTRRRSIPRAFP